MHIFPSLYPSSNLSCGNLWAKGNTFVNGPWWIFPSVNLLSWTYVHSLLPPCNMWCDGEKKSSFSLLLETFLVSFHLVPHFVLCHHPFTCLKDFCPCVVCHPVPSWRSPGWSLILDQKTFLRERGAAPRVGLASPAADLGGWSCNSSALASRMG